jgi:hypothetical protein
MLCVACLAEEKMVPSHDECALAGVGTESGVGESVKFRILQATKSESPALAGVLTTSAVIVGSLFKRNSNTTDLLQLGLDGTRQTRSGCHVIGLATLFFAH